MPNNKKVIKNEICMLFVVLLVLKTIHVVSLLIKDVIV